MRRLGQVLIEQASLHAEEVRLALLEASPQVTVLIVVDGLLRVEDRGPANPERAAEWIVHLVAPAKAVSLTRDRLYRLTADEPGSVLLVTIPIDVVEAYGVPVPRGAQPLLPRSSLTLPAMGFYQGVLAQTGDIDVVAQYALARLAEELVGSLFLESAGLSAERAEPRRSLYRHALALIATRRSDPALEPTSLASELAVSLRHLQRAFREQGTTPALEIRRLRIALAVQLLTDARYDVLGIDEIAGYSGFIASDDLRRAFRLERMPSPSTIRRQRETPPSG